MSNNSEQQPQQQAILQNVVQCISMTQTGNVELIKKATSQLESQHQRPRFGLLLLKLLTQPDIDQNIRMGAAIYFKNYVKKYWGRDEDIISEQDQNYIKTAIVRVMLAADKNSQRLISEAITIIASYDFYKKWDTLLPV